MGRDPDGRPAPADHGRPHRPALALHRTRARPITPAPAGEDGIAGSVATQERLGRCCRRRMAAPPVVPIFGSEPQGNRAFGGFQEASCESRVKRDQIGPDRAWAKAELGPGRAYQELPLHGGGGSVRSRGLTVAPVVAPTAPPISTPTPTPIGPPISPIAAPAAAPPVARSGCWGPHAVRRPNAARPAVVRISNCNDSLYLARAYKAAADPGEAELAAPREVAERRAEISDSCPARRSGQPGCCHARAAGRG